MQNIYPTEMAYLVQDIKSSRNMPVWGENDVTGSKTKSTNAKKVRDDDDLQPQVRSSAATIIRRYENGSQYCRYKFNFLPTKLSPASSFFF